jgi:hypothetical protein
MKYIAMGLGLALAASVAACGVAFDEEAMEAEPTSSTAEAIGYTAPFSWNQGQPAVGLGSVSNSVCFLTEVKGRFAGEGEEVGIFGVSPGVWHLGGTSLQTGVGATARCLTGRPPSTYTQPQYWDQGTPSVALGRIVNGNFVQADGSDSCFLVSMRGRFDGFGEEIKTTFVDGKWWLTGKSQQGGVRAGAQCVHLPRRTTYSWTHPSPQQILQPDVTTPLQMACFLSRVTGYFDASTWVGANITVQDLWSLRGDRNTGGELKGSAACVF